MNTLSKYGAISYLIMRPDDYEVDIESEYDNEKHADIILTLKYG